MHSTDTNDNAAPIANGAPAGRTSRRPPIAEVSAGWRLAAATAAAIALACSLVGPVPIATAIALIALLPAVLVDVVEGRLPNRLVALAAGFGLATLLVESLVSGDTDVSRSLMDATLGAAAMAGPLLILHVAAPAAMGFGDVKAAAVAGAAVGLVDPILGLVALAIGSAGAAVAGLAGRRRTIAFGPGIVGGAILALALVVSPLDPFDIDPHPTDAATRRAEELAR